MFPAARASASGRAGCWKRLVIIEGGFDVAAVGGATGTVSAGNVGGGAG